MAEIMTVRQFNHSFRRLKPGTEVVVVDGSRKKVVAAMTIKEAPEQIEKNIKVLFTR